MGLLPDFMHRSLSLFVNCMIITVVIITFYDLIRLLWPSLSFPHVSSTSCELTQFIC